MGVTGLWDLLSPVGHRVSNEHVRNKVLAVDISIWLTQFVKAMRDSDGANIRNAHLLGVLSRCLKLLFLSVKPVLVFDGDTPQIKRRTLAQRNATRERHAAKLRRLAEKLLLNRIKSSTLSALVPNKVTVSPASRKRAHVSQNSAEFLDLSVCNKDGANRVNDGVDSENEVVPGENSGDIGRGGSRSSVIHNDNVDNDSGDVDSDDNEELVALPEKIEDIDDDALVSLPTSMQSEVLKQIKLQHRARHREQMLKRQNDAVSFSQSQISGFLRNTALNTRISRVRNAINMHSGASQRIASDSARQYVLKESVVNNQSALDESDDEDKDDIDNLLSPKGAYGSKPVDILAKIRAEKDAQRVWQEHIAEKEAVLSRKSQKDMSGVAWASKVLEGKGGLVLGGHRLVNSLRDKEDDLSDNSMSNDGEVGQQWAEGTSLCVNPLNEAAPTGNHETGKANTDSEDEWEDGALDDDHFEPGFSLQNNIHQPIQKSQTDNPIISTDGLPKTPISRSRLIDLDDEDADDSGSYHGSAGIPRTVGAGLDLPNFAEAKNVPKQIETKPPILPVQMTDLDKEDANEPINRGSATTGLNTRVVNKAPDDGASGVFEQRTAVSGDVSKFINVLSDAEDTMVQKVPSSCAKASLKEFSNGPIPNGVSQESNANERGLGPSILGKIESSIRSGDSRIGTNCFQDAKKVSVIDGSDTSNEILPASRVVDEKAQVSREAAIGKEEIFRERSIPDSEEAADLQLAIERSLQQKNSDWNAPRGELKLPVETSIGDKPKVFVEPLSGEKVNPECVHQAAAEKKGDLSSTLGPKNNSCATRAVVLQDEAVDEIQPAVLPQRMSVHAAARTHGERDDNVERVGVSSCVDGNQPSAVNLNRNSEPVISSEEATKLRKELEAEERDLQRQKASHRAGVETVSDEMYGETRDLLKLLGIPYLQAPMEAEAQCAFLNMNKVVDGIITEDSDSFLFGAITVYRQLFVEGKFAEAYETSDIQTKLGLGRDQLIRLAYLLGSDYTPGVRGVGVVNSMEILEAFPGEEGLHEFREWTKKVTILEKEPEEEVMQGTSQDAVRLRFCWKHRNMKRNWEIREGFPNALVAKEYRNPEVNEAKERFKWGQVDFDGLAKFCWDKFGWQGEKFDNYVGPLKKELMARSGSQQRRIDEFFKPHTFAKIRSERLQKAVQGIVGEEASDLMAAILPRVPRRKRNPLAYVPKDFTEEEDAQMVKALEEVENARVEKALENDNITEHSERKRRKVIRENKHGSKVKSNNKP